MREELSYAKVTRCRYKPQINIPEEVIDKNPEYVTNDKTDNTDNDDNNEVTIPNDEQIEYVKKSIEKSSKIIGFRPISSQDIYNEDNRIVREKLVDPNLPRSETRVIATKNLVAKFMKVNLHMSEASRKSVKITSIFPGSDEDTDILYLKCKSQL